MSGDGYVIQEATAQGVVDFAFYDLDEPGAVDACRYYNRRMRGRRAFRVVLRVGDSVAVIHG